MRKKLKSRPKSDRRPMKKISPLKKKKSPQKKKRRKPNLKTRPKKSRLMRQRPLVQKNKHLKAQLSDNLNRSRIKNPSLTRRLNKLLLSGWRSKIDLILYKIYLTIFSTSSKEHNACVLWTNL